jgi:glyoxylase-like metal-dependent hydrolase (beta-lactamase superfamily II)
MALHARRRSAAASGATRTIAVALALWAMLAVAAALLAGPATAQQNPPTRAITEIAPNLYRFQNNFHFSVFLVTDDGVLATDPINADAATWLEGEIRNRFGKEIRYVVLSHDHADHSSGGEVWADTAVVVAHDNARPTIIAAKRPTAVPALTFSDTLTVQLGGQTVELAYVGRNHSDNSIVVRFPAQRALFAVDFIPVKAVAFRDFPDAWLPDWIESLKRVEAMDFDILLPGHGPVGTKADVAAFRGYMEDLWQAVGDAVKAGKSVDEAKAEITLEKYKDWGQYEMFRELNVEGAYRHFALHWRR